jgi:hypothetical protein
MDLFPIIFIEEETENQEIYILSPASLAMNDSESNVSTSILI